MAIHCINTNSNEFKRLVKQTNINPLKLSANIAEWQQEHNTDKFPNKNELFSYIDQSNLNKFNEIFIPKEDVYNRELYFSGLFVSDNIYDATVTKEIEPYLLPLVKKYIKTLMEASNMHKLDVEKYMPLINKANSIKELPNIEYVNKWATINMDKGRSTLGYGRELLTSIVYDNMDKLPLHILFKDDIIKKNGKYYSITKKFKPNKDTTTAANKVSSWHKSNRFSSEPYDYAIRAKFKPDNVELGRYTYTSGYNQDYLSTRYIPEYITSNEIEIDLDDTISKNKNRLENSGKPNVSFHNWESIEERDNSIVDDAYETDDLFEQVDNYFNKRQNKNNISNIQAFNDIKYQNNTDQSYEDYIASEKTIRDLAERMADRIGLKVRYESDRTRDYKGKLEGDTAVINLAYATLDTPIHEILGHPIIKAIKNNKRWIDEGKNTSFKKGPELIGKIDLQKKSPLYQNLLKELETGKGKEVLDRVKRDYQYKDRLADIDIVDELNESDNFDFGQFKQGETKVLRGVTYKYRLDNKRGTWHEQVPMTLEEQQEESIVELLGLYTADRLDKVKDGKLISLLKRLLKEMKAYMKSLFNSKEVEIDKLPDNMTLGDIADLLAYSNSKLILPGNEVIYTTPDNQTFKTYQEASNHISELVNKWEVPSNLQHVTEEQSKAIDELWKEYPELKKISKGSKELYQQYLDSIFPESKARNIVYHSYSGEDFDKFNTKTSPKFGQNYGQGSYFTPDLKIARDYYGSTTGGKYKSVILNIKNPYSENKPVAKTPEETTSKLEGMGYDSVFVTNNYKNTINLDGKHIIKKDKDSITILDEVVVFEPEQIHILGSKQDIKGFKEFINNNNDTNKIQASTNLIHQNKTDLLSNLNTKLISELQNTIEYQLLNEIDMDIDKRAGQSYIYLSGKERDRFINLLESNKEYPKEFKVTKQITKYEKDTENPLKFNGVNEFIDFYYIKTNNNKKSNLYDIVNKNTGEIIASKVRVLSVNNDSKSKIAELYGLEYKPTKVFNANRSIAFTLYRQKPSKAKYIAQAKHYLYDAIKFLNPEESNLKINLDKIEELLNSFPDDMWDYINTTYSPENSTNINASTNIQNQIKFNLPKLGLIHGLEKNLGIELLNVSFKVYDDAVLKLFKYSDTPVKWGSSITINNKLTTKQLHGVLKYYITSKNIFKTSSEEENARKYAEHNNIDYNKLKPLVFGDIDNAFSDIKYNNTGNSDTMELSKWRQSIRNYNWQYVELLSKPYEEFQNAVVKRITDKFKDKKLSNGISHLEYFFNSNKFNWLNINFNNISGTYYKNDMETKSDVGVTSIMRGIINPFEEKIYTKPKSEQDYLKEKEVFNRLAAILHEPMHALHALSYGTKEELDLRKAFDNLYNTKFGNELIKTVFGTIYNHKDYNNYDTIYKEFIAFSTQLMLYPKQWIQNTDLRSNDIYEFIEKIQTLQDKTYTELVEIKTKIGTTNKTISIEEKIQLNFLEKLYNYIIKALNKIIPISKKFTNVIANSKLVDKEVIEDVFGTEIKEITKVKKLDSNIRDAKVEFLQAMDELKSAINTLMEIDSKLFSSDNISKFFNHNDQFNQKVPSETQASTDLKTDSIYSAQTTDHVNKLLSYIAYNIFDHLEQLTLGDFKYNNKTFKTEIIESLTATIDNQYDNLTSKQQLLVRTIQHNLNQPDSLLWRKFSNHFSRIYKYMVTDVETLQDENTFGEIPQIYDDRQQLKINRTDNISTRIKFLLSGVQQGINELTGLPELIDQETLLNRLINAHTNDITNDDFLNTLRFIRDNEYQYLDELISELEQDENLLNGYITSLNFDMVYSYNVITKDVHNNKIFDILDQNRSSFVSKLDFDKWTDAINVNLKANKLTWLEQGYAKFPNISKLIKQGNTYNIKLAYKFDTNDMLNTKYKFGINGFDDQFENDNLRHLEILGTLLTNIGIDINYATLKDLYFKYKNNSTNARFKTEVLKPISYLLFDIATARARTKSNNFNYAKARTQSGTLFQLAKINAPYSKTRTQLDYLDIENNTNYTPIYHSYISRLFKGLNTEQAIRTKFEKFTHDVKFQHSNLLWGDNGIFKYKIVNGKKEILGVKLDVVRNLEYKFFNGIRSLTSNMGLAYTDLSNYNWDIIQMIASTDNIFFVPSSDAGRISSIKMNMNVKEEGYILEDGKVKSINMSTDSMQLVHNTILQELVEMRSLTNHMFEVVDEQLVLRSDLGGDISATEYMKQKAHPVKHWNGKEVLDKNGYPTGKAFQFNNLTYTTNENGKIITHSLNDVLTGIDHLTDPTISARLLEKINQFIVKALTANINKQLDYFNKLESTLKQYSKEDNSQVKNVEGLKEKVTANKLFKSTKDYNNKIALFYIKNYLAQVEIENFVNGNLNEYPNINDYNKRINESIKNGLGTLSQDSYKILHVNDIVRNSPFAKLIEQLSNVNKDVYNNIESTDGLSIITDIEFERRAKLYGREDQYKDILNNLRDTDKSFDANEYTHFLESQKYFYYSRELDYTFNKDNPEILSKQYKDSTIVLSPSMVKGTQLEKIYNYMLSNQAAQISFGTASKVGNINKVTLFDKDGNFNPELDNVTHLLQDAYYKDLVVQLDLPSHAMDHSNKIGVQLEKTIFNNIDANIDYYVNGIKIKGIELRKHAHRLIGANIKDSAFELLKEFDGIENNQIKYDENGNVDINKAKLIRFLKDYVKNNEPNELISEILGHNKITTDEINDDGSIVMKDDAFTNLPIYNGLTLDKFTSIVLALFTNRVINQRINGNHSALVPEFGLNPSDLSYLKPDKIDEYKSLPKAIDWINSIYEDIKNGKRKDFKLQVNTSTDDKGNTTHVAEVVMSPWLKTLYQEGDIVNINDLTEEARTGFGIRIPTEGKQSTVYFKVVGFLKTGASQVIAPFEFISKTGWDYDIDTIYNYMKELYINKSGKYKAIEYKDGTSEEDIKDRYYNYIKNTKEAYDINNKYYHNLNKLIEEQQEAKRIEYEKIGNVDLLEKVSEYIGTLLTERYSLQGEQSYLYSIRGNLLIYNNRIKDISIRINEINSNIDDIKSKMPEGLPIVLSKANAYVNKIYKKLKDQLKSDYHTELRSQLSLEEFNKFTIEEQNSRAARNNRLIDIFGSIVSHPLNIDEYYKPNDMSHIEKISNYINELWGYKLEGLNINNSIDAATLRNLNMSVRKLKGNSVAWDSLMSIFNQLGVKSNIPIRIEIEKDKIGLSKKELNAKFDSVIEKDNTFVIQISSIATDKNGNPTDIYGDKITNQSSEVTTNILDAVKKIMGFNINEHTLGIFKLLSGNAYSVLHEGENNHFLHPYLFVHQPIIVKAVQEFTLAQAQDINAKFNNTLTQLRDSETLKYYELLLPDLINEYGDENHKTIQAIKAAIKKNKYLYLDEDAYAEFNNTLDKIESNKHLEGRYDVIIPTITELTDSIKNKDLTDTDSQIKNTYDNLKTIKIFTHLQDIAGNIVSAISTLNTDKLGTGPTFNINRTLDNNIINLLIDTSKLKVLGFTREQSAAIRSLIKNTNVSLRDKIKMLLRVISKEELNELAIFTDNKSNNLIYTIFNNLFNRELVLDHEYSTLENYYTYGNELAMNTFTQFFPHEHGRLYKLKTKILRTPSLLKDDYLNKLVNNYFNTTVVKDLPFFITNDRTEYVTAIEKKGLIPNPELITALTKHKIFGLARGIENYTNPNTDLYINVNNPTNKDVNKFNMLTLADRLLLLKASKTIKNITSATKYNNNHILDYIDLREGGTTENRTYFNYKVNNAVLEQYARDSITDMYMKNGDNPLINNMLYGVITDMIRAHYWTSGIAFNNNITKYLDVALLHDNHDNTEVEGLSLFDYSAQLFKLENDPNIIDDNIITAFHKANWANPKLVPLVKPQTYTRYEGTIEYEAIKSYYASFRLANQYINGDMKGNADMSSVESHIITEDVEKLKHSGLYGTPYIKVIVNNSPILFKLLESDIYTKNDKVRYYPINRTLGGEYNSTSIKEFNELIEGQLIYDESVYLEYLEPEEIYNDFTGEDPLDDNTQASIDLVSLTNKGTTEVEFTGNKFEYAKNLKDKLGNSIYLGDINGIFNKPLNYNNHLQLDINNDIVKLAKSLTKFINKQDTSEIFIVGDINTNLNQEQLNGKISEVLRLIKINSNRDITIHTLLSKGVNEALINNIFDDKVVVHKQDKDTYQVNEPQYSVDLKSRHLIKDRGTYEDKLSLNNQMNLLVESLRDLVDYDLLYKDQNFNYKKILENIKDRINNTTDFVGLVDKDARSVDNALAENIKVLNPMASHMVELLASLRDVNFNKLDTYSVNERTKLAKKVRQLIHLATRFDFIDDIKMIDDDRVSDEYKVVINGKIKELKDIKLSVNNMIDATKGISSKFVLGLFNIYSTNPEFNNVKTRTLKALDEDGKFNQSKFDESELTPDDAINEFKQIMTGNESMSMATLYLDSVLNTGIPLVDSVLKSYISIRSEKNKRVNSYIDKLNKILIDYYGKGVDINITGSNAEFEVKFRKFINTENGNLRTKYNWASFYKSYNEHKEKINSLKSSILAYETLIENILEKEISLEEKETKIKHYKTQIQTVKNRIKEQYKTWEANNIVKDLDSIRLTKEEREELENVIKTSDSKQTAAFIKKKRYRTQYVNGRHLYVKLIPQDKYLDNTYSKFNKEDIKFITEYKALLSKITDLFPHLIISDDFLPIGLKQGIKASVKQTFGISKKNKEVAVERLGDIIVERDVPMTVARDLNNTILYDVKNIGETVTDYEKRILEDVNSRRSKYDFKSIKEIKEYNDKILKQNADYINKHRNFNPLTLMRQFIYQANEHKQLEDFNNYLQLLINKVGSPEFTELQKDSRARRKLNKISTRITGQKIYENKSGKRTTAYKRLTEAIPSLNEMSNVNSSVDQVAKVLKSFTSLTYMAGNVLGGIKNVMTGNQNILMESAAKQFITTKDLKDAVAEYMANTKAILGDLGNEYSENLTSAIIKSGHDLLELRDTNEQIINSRNNEARLYMLLNNSLYMPNNAGEHFMQNVMLLAMMRSHRLINNQYISFEQFKLNKKEEVMLSVLDSIHQDRYLEFKEKATANKSRSVDLYDYVNQWLEVDQNATMANRKEYVKKYKEEQKKWKAEFNKYNNIYDQFELKDGRAVIKKDSELSDEQYALFMNKVQKVNHSLHGIYNQLDKAAARNRAVVDLAFQFRSWLKPNWDRYFGKRFGRTTYNEGLETYQKGVFISAYDFMTTPFRAVKEYGSNQTKYDIFKKAMVNYGRFFLNAGTHYNMLNDVDKANIRRLATNFLHIIGTSLLLGALGKLVDDDDDKEINSKMLALAIYELNSYHSEIVQFIPIIGTSAFISRTKENPMAAQRVLYELGKTAMYAVDYPFNPENRLYEQGMYKGQTKLVNQIGKITPLYRQQHKWDNLSMYAGWYKMHDPFNLTGL